MCSRLAFAELGDLAATLARELGGGPVRAAVVAATPDQAAERLAALVQLLDSGASEAIDVPGGLFLGRAADAPRIGYLFPGQGSGQGTEGALRRRFAVVRDLGQTFSIPADGDLVATAVAQPRIVSSSIEGLRVLALLGIEAEAAVGHSLGELTALHWAGAMDEAELLALATERGRVMAQASEGGGAMASIAAGPDQVEPLLLGADGTGGKTARRSSSPATTAPLRPSSPVRPRRSSGCAARPRRPTWSRAGSRSRTPSTRPMVAPAAAGLDALPGRPRVQAADPARAVHRHR